MSTKAEVVECGECRYWNLQEVGQGQCRMNPPSTFPVPTQQGLTFFSVFPNTKRDEGCAKGETRKLVMS